MYNLLRIRFLCSVADWRSASYTRFMIDDPHCEITFASVFYHFTNKIRNCYLRVATIAGHASAANGRFSLLSKRKKKGGKKRKPKTRED